METIINIANQLGAYINVMYLCTFMLLSYLVKTYFQVWINKVFKREVKLVFIVLIIATITAIPYLLLCKECGWQKILFSYTLGTSLHEVIFTYVEKKIKKLLE